MGVLTYYSSAYTYCPLGYGHCNFNALSFITDIDSVLKNDHHNKSELYFEVRNIMQRFDSLVLIICVLIHIKSVDGQMRVISFVPTFPFNVKTGKRI